MRSEISRAPISAPDDSFEGGWYSNYCVLSLPPANLAPSAKLTCLALAVVESTRVVGFEGIASGYSGSIGS